MIKVIIRELLDRDLRKRLGYRVFVYENNKIIRIKDYVRRPNKKNISVLLLKQKKELKDVDIDYDLEHSILVSPGFKKMDQKFPKKRKPIKKAKFKDKPGQRVKRKQLTEWQRTVRKYGIKEAKKHYKPLIHPGKAKPEKEIRELKLLEKKFGVPRAKVLYEELLKERKGGDIVKFINKLFPKTEFHTIDQGDDNKIRVVNWCGPGTQINKRLEGFNPQTGSYRRVRTPGINRMDRSCMLHDIAYSVHKDIKSRHEADRILIKEADNVLGDNKSTLLQRGNAKLIKEILKAKIKFGGDMDTGDYIRSNCKSYVCNKSNQINRL